MDTRRPSDFACGLRHAVVFVDGLSNVEYRHHHHEEDGHGKGELNRRLPVGSERRPAVQFVTEIVWAVVLVPTEFVTRSVTV